MSKILGQLMLIYSLFGYLAHLARRFTTDGLSGSRRDIANYVMGVVLCLPLGTYMFDELSDDVPRPTVRFMISYLFTFCSFGIGVVLGHLYDGD